jgi:uncharacterized protein YggT (Ycf19 family)
MKEIICSILSWNWIGISQSLIGFATLCIAISALNVWKKQHKASQVSNLLDQLTDSVHSYLQSLSVTIQYLNFAQIGIDSYQFDMNVGQNSDKKLWVIKFIEKEGKETSERLFASLRDSEASYNKIKSLLVKGQIYSIPNFVDCINSCNNLLWQYDRLQAFAVMVGSPNLNWDNPKAEKGLENILDLTNISIDSFLKKHQKVFFDFSRDTFQNLYQNA